VTDNAQSWMLIWLFFIALGSCSPKPAPKVNVTVDQCEVLPGNETGDKRKTND